jgi:Ca2+-binding RTX toxin-like protein
VTLFVQTSTIYYDSDSEGALACRFFSDSGVVAATPFNTDAIDIGGTNGNERVVLDQSRGAFAPGMTTEASGLSEIELVVKLGSGFDSLAVVGTMASDTITFAYGTSTPVFPFTEISLNADDDGDIAALGSDAHSVDGFVGDDMLSGDGGGARTFQRALTIMGGAGHDVITGGSASDHIYGGTQGDSIKGGAGSDTIDGGNENDWLAGGDGADRFLSPTRDGADIVYGGASSDTIDYSGRGADLNVDISTAASSDGEHGEGDRIYQVEHVLGGSGHDRITGNPSANSLFGGAGDDIISGREGENRIDGGQGDDLILGGPQRDDVVSSLLDGSDRFIGAGGYDSINYGGRERPVTVTLDALANDGSPNEGDAVISVEKVVGGNRADYIAAAENSSTANSFSGGPGDDVLVGRGGRDDLSGGPGNDNVAGGAGIDALFSSPSRDGADVLRGGSETDTVYYNSRIGGLTIRLDNMANDGEAGEGDNVGPGGDIENVVGGRGPDVIIGNKFVNDLYAGDGNDRVTGGSGRDWLWGGFGTDAIYAHDGISDNRIDGGQGSDTAEIDAGDVTLNVEFVFRP